MNIAFAHVYERIDQKNINNYVLLIFRHCAFIRVAKTHTNKTVLESNDITRDTSYAMATYKLFTVDHSHVYNYSQTSISTSTASPNQYKNTLLSSAQQWPGIKLDIQFGLSISNGQSLGYLPVCSVFAAPEDSDG